MIFDTIFYIAVMLFGSFFLISKLTVGWGWTINKVIVKIFACYIIVISILKLLALYEYF